MSQYPSRGMRNAWQRPQLRDDGDKHRPVGWVELFFDLIFVVIIAVLASNLETGGSLLVFVLQFMAVFWVWNAFTYYTERFESHGLENRLFTFVAILAVAGLAIWGRDGLGANYVGFAISYLLARCLNIGLWLRAAAHVPRFRRAAFGFAAGFLVSMVLLGASFFVPVQVRLVLWALAVLIEIFTPAVTARFQDGLPLISRDKFPERFGLLTLIVLGETVSGVITSVAAAGRSHALPPITLVGAAMGLLIGFGLWWVYFDFIARRPSRPTFNMTLTWVYLHLAMLIGVVVVGVAITEALRETALTSGVRTVLLIGLGYTMIALAVLELTLDRARDEPSHPVASPVLKAATGTLLCGLGLVAPPVTTIEAFGIAIIALGIQAAYGSVVWYRRSSRASGTG